MVSSTWWEIESIKDGVMKWTALRMREDGTTYTATFSMTKKKKKKNVGEIGKELKFWQKKKSGNEIHCRSFLVEWSCVSPL